METLLGKENSGQFKLTWLLLILSVWPLSGVWRGRRGGGGTIFTKWPGNLSAVLWEGGLGLVWGGEDHGRWGPLQDLKEEWRNQREIIQGRTRNALYYPGESQSMLTTSVLLPFRWRNPQRAASRKLRFRCPGLSLRLPASRVLLLAGGAVLCPALERRSPRRQRPQPARGCGGDGERSHQLAGNFLAGNDWAFAASLHAGPHGIQINCCRNYRRFWAAATGRPAETRPRQDQRPWPRRRPGRGGGWRGSAGAGRPGATMLCFPSAGTAGGPSHQTSPARRNSRGSCREPKAREPLGTAPPSDAFSPHRPLLSSFGVSVIESVVTRGKDWGEGREPQEHKRLMRQVALLGRGAPFLAPQVL